MIKDVIRSINSLEIWGTMAILLFLAVFIYWCFAAFLLKNSHREHMSRLPLEDDNQKGIHHE